MSKPFTLYLGEPKTQVKTLKALFESDKNTEDSLTNAYYTLAVFAHREPQLDHEYFDAITTGLKSDKNTGSSLKWAYEAFGSIVLHHPNLDPALADVIFYEFGSRLLSDKNDSNSLRQAYAVLKSIAQIKPTFAKHSLDVLEKGLQSRKNNNDSLRSAYYALESIVQAEPTLTKQVNNIKAGLESNNNLTAILKQRQATR
jgi:hypothetical protein